MYKLFNHKPTTTSTPIGRAAKACLLLLPLLLLPSCSRQEADVFDDSAANRLNKAVREYIEVLEAQETGWVLDFYPADRSLGGMAYTARFHDGDVTMTCELGMKGADGKVMAVGDEVESCYRVITERSVLLTFDTYNPLLHYWSEPDGNDSDGFASDYEFVFVSASPDSVVLRGKKYGNLLRMYPLHESASEYVKKVAANKSALSTVPRQRAIVDGNAVPVSILDNHFNYSGADGKACHVPFVYTPNGIRFYEPVTLTGFSFREMTLDEDGQLCAADGHIQLPMPTLMERFTGSMTQWHFLYSTTNRNRCQMCDELYYILMEAISTCMMEAWESVGDMYIGTNKLPASDDAHRTVIGWSTTLMSFGYEVAYAISMEVLSEEENIIAIKPLEGATLFYNYPFFQPIVDFVCNNSPYVLTFNNTNNPTQVTLRSQKDEEQWFTLRLR